ncbi:MAG TPA: helix-turn-helix transcriptional regulator [Ktedonobacteraceae bacterium]|nr:helix-turn-helix transcriptional regulator [Ktedonobacteraceae bacterium]
MDRQTLQQLKVAWIAAKEAGDTQAQVALLRDYPESQDALVSFIAAYRATEIDDSAAEGAELSSLTRRALQTAMGRVFPPQATAANLRELRQQRGFSLTGAAQGLRLGADVWKKFESGAIELASLTQKQLDRLAHFFNVSAAQFGSLLTNSQPSMTMNRRQTASAARQDQQAMKPQSFTEAIERSSMTKEEKGLWME